MTRAILSFHCTVLLCLLWAGGVNAQEPIEVIPQAEQVFRRGVQRYSDGAYGEAASLFEELMRTYPASSRLTAAFVMKGKALFHMRENLESAKTLKTFLTRYPGSSYAADAHLTLGLVYRRIGRPVDAVDELVEAWRAIPATMPAQSRSRLEGFVSASLDTVIDESSVQLPMIYELIANSATAEERAYFWLKAAEKQARKGTMDSAGVAVDTVLTHYGYTRARARAAALKDQLTGMGEIKVGLLLPLMLQSPPSALREPGNEVREGILVAYDRFLREAPPRLHVTLEERDTEREPSVALRRARELSDDPAVVCIIGPVFSASASAAVPAVAPHGIPLVTPTANANGIAAVGKTIFQANPDYDMRGRAMARYAIRTRGWTNLAVLAPNDTYAKFLADGFIDEAARLGGQVVATEWYQKGTKDLKTQLATIRRAALETESSPLISFAGKMSRKDLMKFVDFGVPPARLDSLLAQGSIVPASMLLGPRAKAKADSLGIKVIFDEGRADSIQVPLAGVDACYAPITSPDDIGVVASQYVYFNLQAQLLGSGEWANMGQLTQNQDYTRGVLFESDSHVDSSDAEYMAFVRAYMARFKRPPTRNALYGYDTARLVFRLLSQGAINRERLAEALASVRDFRGIHSRIGFSPGRVNSWLHILEFTGEGIGKVGEVHVEEEEELHGPE